MLHLHRKKASTLACRTGRLLRTVLLLLFGLFSSFQSLFAQPKDLNLFDHDSKPYYFGITLGVNLARFQTDLHSRFLEYDSVLVAEPINSGGFTLGLSATGRLSDRFEARFNPQLMFIERNIFYKLKYPDFDGQTDVTKKVESVIMSFPFQIKFNSDRINNFRVYMMTGAKVDIDMASNARAKRAEDLVKIDKFDYGIELGLGFNFFFPSFIFSPEIKISNGFRNIHSRDENLKFSSVFDKIQSRMIVFCIHLEG
ncbi:MAG: outer membrane beta-barrel protein [Bacteroidia bacterium]|nr:outer membrane beta-barrel protein [Bacteroidia bacterium]